MERGKEIAKERPSEKKNVKGKEKEKGKEIAKDRSAEKKKENKAGHQCASSLWRIEDPAGASSEKKKGKKTGHRCESSHGRNEATAGECCAFTTSAGASVPGVSRSSFQLLTLKPNSIKVARVTKDTLAGKISIDGCSTSKRVGWADQAGCALTQTINFQPGEATPITRPRDTSLSHGKRRSDRDCEKPKPTLATGLKRTYKEALLTPKPKSTELPRRSVNYNTFPTLPGSISFRRRCYRCLGTNHRASNCRAPFRCWRCYKTGHFARTCMERLPMSVYRAMRARPSYLSAFVPLTDDFHTRQNRCRNAILVDVLRPRNLGHFPQESIANKLASRFRGFPTDFHVARYSERDFIIFLPEWVPCDQLLRREFLALDDLRLQCFPWRPWSGARRAQLTYNVWIRLVSLPYECWSSRTVAALVGVLADSSVLMIFRFAWSISRGVDPANPPNERTDQHDPRLAGPDALGRSGGSVRGRRSSAGGSSNSDASWYSSEIRDRRRAVFPPGGTTQQKTSPAPTTWIGRHDEKTPSVFPAIEGKKLGFGPVIIGKRNVTDQNLNSTVADVVFSASVVKDTTWIDLWSGGAPLHRLFLEIFYPQAGLLTSHGGMEHSWFCLGSLTLKGGLRMELVFISLLGISEGTFTR
uniref:CCHC-type domain-containing protein n=1 Tax=Ananas comosus var. bracteatus TaxID=296719 RepID=A0A6V7NU61_ANACO|nr:unnamed protein product [Ananas comosus var. bracteatus]